MPVHDWTRVDAGIFHHFHTTWIALMAARLNEELPSDYYALAEQRAMGLGPDILTLGREPTATGNGSAGGSKPGPRSDGGVRLAESPPKIRFALSRPGGYKQRRIAVRRTENDRIVAAIEIVSPGNKASRNQFSAFVAKAAEFVSAGIHLVVIDLLPPTPRDPEGIHQAIWGAETEPVVSPSAPQLLTVASYVAGPEERAYVELLAVGDPLPASPLFLEPDFYAPLPLEETYMAAFRGIPRHLSAILTAPVDGGGAGNGA